MSAAAAAQVREQIAELESRPATVRDAVELRRTATRIRMRLEQGKPVSRDQARLATLAQRATQRLEQRQALRPRQIEFPEELPVVERRDAIAQLIERHQVVVVCGETGSGKTTQLPKICIELGRGVRGLIGHTQPRRLAARSVARRIAEELGEPGRVGWKVRFQDETDRGNLIRLMTDGILLAEIQRDPDLLAYDTLILDEAHERSLNIDFLLGYLKRLLPRRPDLKLIITSATIDPQSFSRHFGDAPVVEVSGRTYPVELRYRPLSPEDGDIRDLEPAVEEAVQELWRHGRGDILVFLAGQRQIRDVSRHLARQMPQDVDVLPLYGRLPAGQQDRIFNPGRGRRRIVLATNVAETSVTVPGIRYVIDAGEARISRYSQGSGVQRLLIEPIAQASADQRAGRCGRLGPGICIRLYGEDDYAGRPRFATPEIQRANLAGVILQMRHLKLGDVDRFPFMDPPERRYVSDGYRLLEVLGAIDRQRELTGLGRTLAALPLDPRVGRIALAARDRASRHAVLVLAAALSVQDPREVDPTRRDEAPHKQWNHERSDFLTLCRLWNEYRTWKRDLSRGQLRVQCREQAISHARMREWEAVYEQLCDLLDMEAVEVLDDVDEAYDDIHQALLTGLVDHVGHRGERFEYEGPRGRRFHLFPGSSLFGKSPPWVMTAELVRTSRVFARTNARINPQWIEQVAPDLVSRDYGEPEWDSRSGRVVAVERVSLFGLALFSRRVNYASVDRSAAREIFIRRALVDGDLRTRGDFLAHNQGLVAEIEALEAKTRRADLLAHEDDLFAFYDRQVPGDVAQARAFEAWRRRAEREQPRCLFMQRSDLLKGDTGLPHEADFPDVIEWEGIHLDLRYELEPGSQHDGITLEVGLQHLRQLEPAPFEWLVPGMLQEKIEALIRSLPKRLRRHVVPAPDFARACAEALAFRRGSLRYAVAERLNAMTGLEIAETDFDTERMPAYLRMNFRVLDETRHKVGEGSDLAALQAELGPAAAQRFRSLNLDTWERENLSDWDFGDLPERRRIAGRGQVMYGYPALSAEPGGVALRMFDNPEEARLSHAGGVRALFLRRLPDACRYVKKELRKHRELQLRFSLVDRDGDVADALLEAAAQRVFELDAAADVRSAEAFARRIEQGRPRLVPVAMEMADQLEPMLRSVGAVRRALEEGQWLDETRADVQRQLDTLVYPGFVTATPRAVWPRLGIYLQAIERRLDRARANPQRDLRQLADLAPLVEAWAGWRGQGGRLESEIEGFGWRLQELRVSLFAQELKARGPVSVKRLRTEWEALRQKLA